MRNSFIFDFAKRERQRFSNYSDNLFSSATSQIIRYYEFLQIIVERYQKINENFFLHNEKRKHMFPNGSYTLNKQQMEYLEEEAKINKNLHLEIESFYLFAKILLDKVCRFLELYFGIARSASLDSHEKLSKNIEKYVKKRSLSDLSKELIGMITSLKKEISDYRDKEIVHDKSPRTMKGTMFSFKEGLTRIFSGKLFPNEEDKQIESSAPNQIIGQIDKYLMSVFEYVSNSRDKTGLELKS